MPFVSTTIKELTLATPNPDRDASFAYKWFSSDDSKDTLLRMGNAQHEISASTLESERQTIEEFLDLEQHGRQKTWMIRWRDETIGAAWIDLVENHGVKPPSVHLMIGNAEYRGRGIGYAVICCILEYLRKEGYEKVYSRHLVSNEPVTRLNDKVGFICDGQAYTDSNGLIWQNISLSL